MRKIFLLLWICTFALAACRKKSSPRPDFGVYGLQDISMVNDGFSVATLPLTVKYSDNNNADLREFISLSVSGLPPNVVLDSNWMHEGYPPYNTSLRLFANTYTGVFPGVYSVTLTASSTKMGTKNISFLLKVIKAPSCAEGLLGKYYYSYSYCTNKSYVDSVYEDPILANKVWFSNFNGTGEPAYALLNCDTKFLSIPPQIIKGVLYEGGSLCPYVREMSLYVHYGSKECTLTLH